MKQILYSIFLFLKNLFLSLKIHLHIGSEVRDHCHVNHGEEETNHEDKVD